MSSTLHECDVLDDTVVRALLLSRWTLTGREADVERTGTSWITWLLVRRGERYRIFHQMESQVYLNDGAVIEVGSAGRQGFAARAPLRAAPPVPAPRARV